MTRESIISLLSGLMKLSMVAAFGLAVFEARWGVTFVILIALLATLVPVLVEKMYDVILPVEFEFAVAFFIYLSLFLGEAQKFYAKFAWWDMALHTISGIALGFVGFLILYTFYSKEMVEAKPHVLAFFVFSFALSLGAVWEIYEFAMDGLFGFNMQGASLNDTMWDLIVDSLGGIVVAVSGYFYLKSENAREGIFANWVEGFLERNPHLRKEI